ncbi:MAG: CvpA family protein [Verrucomicrobiae bacterium]|nr:CvpA family protein [Verrucomicrobiae bacterium]
MPVENWWSFNFADIALLLVMAAGALLGWRNGLARETFNLLASLVAVITGANLYLWAGWLIHTVSSLSPMTSGLVALILSVVGAVWGVRLAQARLVAWIVGQVRDFSRLQLYGSLTGAVRGLVLGSFLIVTLSLVPLQIFRGYFGEGSFVGRHLNSLVVPLYDRLIGQQLETVRQQDHILREQKKREERQMGRETLEKMSPREQGSKR